MSFVSHVQGLSNNGAKLPVFTVGLDDGEAVELLNAAVAPSSSIKTRVRWKVETLNGLRAANIVGVLPGQTNESIVMVSHLDAYFDGANDNAAGLASMLGVAEYFAGRPKEQRRRTMYFVGIADHHTGDAGGRRIHDAWQDVFSRTAVILNAEHVALGEPVWDRSWGSNVRPSLIKTNQLSPSWWGVHGSDRLANIIREDFAAFGVPTQIEPGGSAGQLRAVQWDAPSFYLHNKGVYYHSSADTADVVPAEGLRTATQAFAKIFDDINKLDLKDLRAAASVSPQSVQTACDRECLRGFITQYLNAMVAHDPKSLPLAANARFTEDTKTLPLGEGLWKGASGLRSYRQDFLDVREGMAASHVIVEEGGNPVMLGLRLKIVDKKLFEIETMVTRNRAEGAIFSIDALRTPKAAMNVVPDSSQRMSRAELIRIAEFYPAGLKVGGSFEAVQAPFAPDAYRLENGGMMAGPGARAGSENIRTQRIIAHPDVSYQIAAVDEELGIVLMRLDFGDTKSYGPGNALTCFEAFKVYGGQIHAVEAFIRIMPANTPSGWNYEVKKPK
jgi:hypothetical protein